MKNYINLNNIFKLKKFISIIVFLGIFYFIYNLVDWYFFLNTIKYANIYFLLIAVFFSILWPIISSIRWFHVLKELGYVNNFFTTFKVVMLSYTANIFAPAKSGDFIKVICHKEISNKGKLFSGVLFDRINDLLSLSFLCFFFSIFVKNVNGLLIGLFIPLSIFFLKLLVNFLITKKKLIKLLSLIRFSISLVLRKNKNTFLVLFFSILNWFIASVQIYFFYLAYGENISLIIILSLFPFVVLIALLPITPSGIGLREISFIYIFSAHADLHTSLMVSLSYYLFNLCITGLFGSIFLNSFIKKKEISKMMRIFKKKINLKKIFKKLLV